MLGIIPMGCLQLLLEVFFATPFLSHVLHVFQSQPRTDPTQRVIHSFLDGLRIEESGLHICLSSIIGLAVLLDTRL